MPLQNRNALFAPTYTSDGRTKTGYGVNKLITETEDLRPYTLAFILGLRSSTADPAGTTRGYGVPGRILSKNPGDGGDVYNGSSVAFQPVIMPGMVGTERFQQLCSLEYLNAYFYNVLRGKTISLAEDLEDVFNTLVNSDRSTGVVGAVLSASRGPAGPGNPGGLGGNTLLNVNDMAAAMGLPNSDAANAPDVLGGIFARDFGPFLKGKGGKSNLVNCTLKNLPQVVGGKQVQPYSVSRNLGDDVAFAMLESLLAQKGVSDWRPDGLVLSKGVNDPSDKLSDEMLEARDGQLYNIRVQGPAVGTTWTGEKSMATLPMDRCFIVIVADVWFNRSWPTVDNTTELDTYNDEREAALKRGLDTGRFKTAQLKTFTGTTKEQTTLCNFRVMASTSSQMVNFSKFVKDAPLNSYGPTTKLSAGSRMGLQLCDDFGEYVVGAWQIGNVMDNSASRAAMPQGSNIGVRTAPNSSALNVNVNIGYWSPDRLHRSFSNVDGGITPRYKRTRPAIADDVINAQASKPRFDRIAATQAAAAKSSADARAEMLARDGVIAGLAAITPPTPQQF